MSQLELLLDKWFTPGFVGKLAAAYRRIYAINMDAHNPDEGGHDNQSFGFLNWKSRCFILAKLADPVNGVIVIRRGKYFALGVGPFEVVPYNAGSSTNRNYAAAFPNNTKGAVKAVFENIEQLRLPIGRDGEEAEFDDSECRKLILCDMGDSFLGVSSLFIGVPIKASNGKIGGWSRTRVLWERSLSDIQVPVLIRAEKLPVEQITKPTIKLKSRDIAINEQ